MMFIISKLDETGHFYAIISIYLYIQNIYCNDALTYNGQKHIVQ